MHILLPLVPTVEDAIHQINASLEEEDPGVLLERLQGHYSGLENIQEHEASQYRNIFRALRTAKAEVGYY